MKHFIFFILFLVFSLSIGMDKVFAASVFVSTPPTLTVRESFEAVVWADIEGVSINSLDITLHYDTNLLSFSGYKSDNTIIGLWVNPPSDNNGDVHFSGIIPGGVSGIFDPTKKTTTSIPVVHLLFTAKAEGEAQFTFIRTKILKHDGVGTEFPHEQINNEVVINNSLTPNTSFVDREKPDHFTVTFYDSSVLSKTPSMLLFSSYDSGSGIKKYEMNEGGSGWVQVESPKPISKGIVDRTVTIRAFDFQGNFQDSQVVVPGYLSSQVLITLFLLIILFSVFVYKMLKYRNA